MDLEYFKRFIGRLLPTGEAFDISEPKDMTSFFKGLADVPKVIYELLSKTFLNIIPKYTQNIRLWSEQFNRAEDLTVAELEARWAERKNLSPNEMQEYIRSFGFTDCYVYECWRLNDSQITNGYFRDWTGDDPDSWTVTESSPNLVTQDGNNCRIVSDSTLVQIRQDVLEVGETYEVLLQIYKITGAGITITAASEKATFNTVGFHKATFVADNDAFAIKRAGTTDVTFGEITVRKPSALPVDTWNPAYYIDKYGHDLLVNLVYLDALNYTLECGDGTECGDPDVECGVYGGNKFYEKIYSHSSNPLERPYYFYVGGILVKGLVEEVENWSFEIYPFEPWYGDTSKFAQSTNIPSGGGTYSAQCTDPTSTYSLYQNLDLEFGETYTAKVYLRGTPIGEGAEVPAAAYVNGELIGSDVSGVWTEYTHDFVAGFTNTIEIRSSSGSGVRYFDLFSVRKASWEIGPCQIPAGSKDKLKEIIYRKKRISKRCVLIVAEEV